MARVALIQTKAKAPRGAREAFVFLDAQSAENGALRPCTAVDVRPVCVAILALGAYSLDTGSRGSAGYPRVPATATT